MNNTLLIILFLSIPVILAVLAWWVLGRLKTPILDAPVNPGVLWRKILGLGITPRQVLKLIILVFPLLYLNQALELVPEFLVVTGFSFYFLFRLVKAVPPLESQSQEVLSALDQISSKLADTRAHLEFLANSVRAKQTEVEAQEKIREAIEQDIAKGKLEKETWENFNEKQRALVLGQVREAQRRGAVTTIIVGIGSIALNLVATLLWTLLGNPGKEQILRLTRGMWANWVK